MLAQVHSLRTARRACATAKNGSAGRRGGECLKTKTAADYAVDRRTLRKQYELVGAMNRAGVRIIAGTMS
jgi:hypothetical protein